MRILHVAPPLQIPPRGYGGTERVIFCLAREQGRRGHEVIIVCGPNSRIEFCRAVSFDRTLAYGKDWLNTKLSGSAHVARAFKYAGNWADIIHNHVAEEGTALTFLARSPCLTTLQGLAHTRTLPATVTRVLGMTRRTKLVAISKSSYLGFRKFFREDLIGYVYNGVDLNDYPFVSQPRKCHELEVVFSGRISPDKGVHLAIRTVDALFKMGYDVHFRILGKIGSGHSEYTRTLIHEINTKKYVTLIADASREDVISNLANSDFFLFPVLWEEPFGVALIEAQACGTPVIAFPRGAIPEIVNDGKDGFLCNTINEMVKSAVEIAQIERTQCRANVEDRFSAKLLCDRYLEVYKKII